METYAKGRFLLLVFGVTAMANEMKIDISDALRKIDIAKEQLPFATALALTRTVQQAQKDAVAGFAVFASVTAATRRSIFYTPASKTKLVAVVGVKDFAQWIFVEVKGGPRNRGIESYLRPAQLPPPGMYAVPVQGSPITTSRDRISLSKLQKVVSLLQQQPQKVAAVVKRRGGTKIEYFALREAMNGLHAGIYQKRGKQITPLLLFVGKPQYTAKYDFYGIVEASIRRNFPEQFKLAAAKAMSTAR